MRACALCWALMILIAFLWSEANADDYEAPEHAELIPFGAAWRAHAGLDEPSDSWQEGDAPLRWGKKAGKKKRGSALDLGESAQEGVWLEKTFTVLEEDVRTLLLEVHFSGGFAVELNGVELLRHRLNLEDAVVPYHQSEEHRFGVEEEVNGVGRRAFKGLDPEALKKGENTLRVFMVPDEEGEKGYFDLRLQSFLEAGFVKGPFLQRPHPEGITVFFETSTLSIPQVEYGKTTSLEQVAILPAAGGAVHQVTLQGLEPGTRYYYRVRAVQVWPLLAEDEAPLVSGIYSFVTPPRDPEASFVFLAYGDNRSQPAVHRGLVERMVSEDDAEFVINTGDLTNSGHLEEEWQAQFFEPLRPLTYHLPLWPAIGNHERNHLSYYTFFDLPEGELWYHFRHGLAEFFALNTCVDMEGDQLEWLEDSLSKSEATWKIVFFHHPAHSCTPARLPGYFPVREHIVPLLERYEVDLVLAGHDHLYARGEERGIHYVVTGGGGAWTYPTQVEPPNLLCEQVHHYCRVRVEENALSLEAIDYEGEQIDAFVISR